VTRPASPELARPGHTRQDLAPEGLAPPDLVRYISSTTGLAPGTAERVVADVIAYFGETTEEFVRRRHGELHDRQLRNAQIWPVIMAELASRPVVAPHLTQRQLRRIVYG
jgi:hypothetical protein